MNDQEILDRAKRAAMSVDGPVQPYDALLRRRDRKRRNQRIAAGVVGIALFVAGVWVVTTGGPFDRTAGGGHRPASSGATAPSVAPPSGTEVDYVLDLDTGKRTPLPNIFDSLDPTDTDGRYPQSVGGRFIGGRYAASPDGSTLAFVGRGDDGNPQIFIAGIDGSDVRQVTHDPVAAITPAWSPDGSRIAYEGGYGSGGVPGLFVLDVATGAATKVTGVSAANFPAWPTFTPDGSSLLYSVGAEVRTIPVAGGQGTLLFGHGRGGMGYAGNGSMSPDGSLVTMMGNEPHGPGAGRFLANADGTDLRPIGGRAGESTPAGTWSPDGTRIVCVDYVGNHILVVDVATGEVTRVAEASEAIWLDDHTLLVEV